ncbi:hypothetical protein [Marininema halotolerans]|uniref:YtkA-like n=1 Tax=Marininema halotolerans TaxID=1155944 RepID=A0A1I6RXA3_9BACL|nr:hypothetical protein [Marininema halotolerans]SFS69329.1 hypothetical protein SAMN05444972_10611 [Marininema halotolerans]
MKPSMITICLHLLLWFLAGSFLLLPVKTFADDQVHLSTKPKLSNVIPHDQPTQLTFHFTNKKGNPIKNARVRYRLHHPSGNPLFSTDFPLVENKTMIEGETLITNGTLQFSETLPIRGTYTATFHVRPTNPKDPSFQSFSQTNHFTIHEKPTKVMKGSTLFMGLVLLGAVAGIIIGRGHKRSVLP